MSDLAKPIRDYIDAYNRMDVDAMLACLEDDVFFQNISNGVVTAETKTRAGFEALARIGVQAFSRRRQTVRGHMTVANFSIVRIDYEATVATDLPNGWKAGQDLSFAGASLFELAGDRIRLIIDQS